MYERRGYNDTSPKVSGKEVNVERYAKPWHSFCYHWEECCEAGDDHDDEQCRDPGSQLTIVLVLRRVESADDLWEVVSIVLPRLRSISKPWSMDRCCEETPSQLVMRRCRGDKA